MSVPERVRAVIEPIVASQDLELFDLEQAGPLLRVTVDRPGGVDLEAIAACTRAISRALDEHDPIAAAYTLEVSSPGLERTLRTPAHFAWAVGRQVTLRTFPNHPLGRRFNGTVTASNDTSVTVLLDEPAGESVTFNLGEIEKARTTFTWGGEPKPGKQKKSAKKTTRDTASLNEEKIQS